MKVYQFGAGSLGEELHANIRKRHQVLAFLDNDPAKQGAPLCGLPVLSPRILTSLEPDSYDAIVVTSSFYPEIAKQLVELGVPRRKIAGARLASAYLDEEEIRSLYALNNPAQPPLSPRGLEMIKAAIDFGYSDWAQKIRNLIEGQVALDVGSGMGLDALCFALQGAKEYWGLDPVIKPDGTMFKNKMLRSKENAGFTPNDIMAEFPQIRLIPGVFEKVAPQKRFDVATLHTVTEHLMRIETVFEGIAERLESDGRIVFYHHNFYCWNGHHLPPKNTADIDETDPKQRMLIDWRHLDFQAPADHYLSYGLNKIRLDELKELTARLFEIETWDEIESNELHGKSRLTGDIMARHSKYSERELRTQGVYCVGRKRAR